MIGEMPIYLDIRDTRDEEPGWIKFAVPSFEVLDCLLETFFQGEGKFNSLNGTLFASHAIDRGVVLRLSKHSVDELSCVMKFVLKYMKEGIL